MYPHWREEPLRIMLVRRSGVEYNLFASKTASRGTEGKEYSQDTERCCSSLRNRAIR